MKSHPFASAVALLILPLGLGAVQPGDTRDAVIAELGAPNGSAAAGDRVVMYYDRGTVQLREGRVAAVSLVSAAELAAREAKEAAAMQRLAEAAQNRRARLEAEGRAIHAAKKVDATFASLPADTQLGYWRQFATRFPMISVESEIVPLADQVDQQIRLREVEAANAARLAALEERLAETEERAARVESYSRYSRYDLYGAGYSFLFYLPRQRHMIDHRSRHRDDACAPNGSAGIRRPATPNRPVPIAPVQAYMSTGELRPGTYTAR